MFPGVQAPEGQQWQEGRGPCTERGVPGHHPTAQGQLPCQPCSSPLAQNDPELRVVQAGDRHIRQLKLLQLPYNCRDTAAQQQLSAGGAPRAPTTQRRATCSRHRTLALGQGAALPLPGQMAYTALPCGASLNMLYSQEKAPSFVSLTRKRLK